jgi:hypothetical protein
MNNENPFKKLLEEMKKANKDRNLVEIIPEFKKDELIAKQLTALMNFKFKDEKELIWNGQLYD